MKEKKNILTDDVVFFQSWLLFSSLIDKKTFNYFSVQLALGRYYFKTTCKLIMSIPEDR